jgi:hypothetical protein
MPRVLPKVEVLRRNVVTKLEAMNEQQLVHVYEWLLQLELEQAVRDLSDEIAADEEPAGFRPKPSNHPSESFGASILTDDDHRDRHERFAANFSPRSQTPDEFVLRHLMGNIGA